MTDYTGIILAGGKSSRMGSDKGLLNYNGHPLVQYSIDLLSSFCKEIIISTNNDAYRQFGFPVINDEYIDAGPAGGLASALKHSKTNWNIVLSCDVPSVNQETIDFLISTNNNSLGVVPLSNGKAEPLIALYHRSFFSVLESNIKSGNLKMQSIISESDIVLLDFESILLKFPDVFRNFNVPGDLTTP